MQKLLFPIIALVSLCLGVVSSFQPQFTSPSCPHNPTTNMKSHVAIMAEGVTAENGALEQSRTITRQKAVTIRQPLPQHSWSRIQQRWSRRLNTHEDARWVHKLSCLSWLLSLGYITWVGALNGFTQIPDSLGPWFWLSSLCTMFLGANGSQMAMKYRSKDPVLKNGFINMALGQSASAIAVLYQGPFCPDWMNHFLVGNGALIISFLPAMIMTLDDALSLKDRLGERDLRPNEPSRMDFGEVGDAITAVLVVLIPLLLMLYAVPMLMDPAHDRTWFLNDMLSGSTEAQAANVYSFVFLNLGAGLGSAAVTLRDRKLISKWAEQVLASVMMVPAFVLAVEAIFLLK